jgi:hypothetical protein
MKLFARISFIAAVSVILIFVVESNQCRTETRSNNAKSDVAQEKQNQSVEAQPTQTVANDNPGAKPDANDPGSKITDITGALRKDPRFEFLKYEIWPSEYQKQKVWQIDYYYNELSLNGLPVLKHFACYFRQGKIVGNTEPASVEEENARRADAESAVSRLRDGTWKDLSESTEAQVEAAATEDARHAWYGLHLKRGSDGQFNWFEMGMKMADAKSVFRERHTLAKGPIQKAYDKKFDEAFNAIAHRIEDQGSGSN